MIKFIGKNVDTEDLKKAIVEALINCTSEAVGPIDDDYDETDLDYSACSSEEDKRRVFAKYHLGEIDIQETANGLILNDYLDVEGTESQGGYDLEKMLLDVKKEFPDIEISGSGEIDYNYSMLAYEIKTKRGKLTVTYEEA